jgi:hypothetical protein
MLGYLELWKERIKDIGSRPTEYFDNKEKSLQERVRSAILCTIGQYNLAQGEG